MIFSKEVSKKLISIASGLGRFAGALLGGFNVEFLTQTGEGLAQFADSIGRIKSVIWRRRKGSW